MCVDFRDLNKTCPKNYYPLPHTNQLIDFTMGHQLISMLDACKGYYQIPLAWEDQDKVSFIIEDDTFYYTVMPFRLKNTGATYQRLMDKVLAQQLGQNVKVYVNDILIKSLQVKDLIGDLEETFATLRNC